MLKVPYLEFWFEGSVKSYFLWKGHQIKGTIYP